MRIRPWIMALTTTLALGSGTVQSAPEKAEIVNGYADIARAMYEDSLYKARDLERAVDTLLDNPDASTLRAARTAWLEARAPYMHTEVYRFGNAIVDDWEGRVNAWPLDEGLIDYVDRSYGDGSDENPLYTANIIASTEIRYGGGTVDATEITPALLTDTLHEIGGIEANVATGYHAIEFLLWGQDLNGTRAGNGDRPWTDYARNDACTNGNCERRAHYLKAATALLVEDLAWMAEQWAPGGEARAALNEGGPDAGLSAMLTGLGSLSYGELAGERMKLGLLLNDPEEEHDCFADNTHNSHYFNVMGMLAVYNGTYTRIDGSKITRPALAELVAEADPDLHSEMHQRLSATQAAMGQLKARAETIEAYDQMLAPENPEGHAVLQTAIDALSAHTRSIERAVTALKLAPVDLFGSDSLDNPEAVFQ